MVPIRAPVKNISILEHGFLRLVMHDTSHSCPTENLRHGCDRKHHASRGLRRLAGSIVLALRPAGPSALASLPLAPRPAGLRSRAPSRSGASTARTRNAPPPRRRPTLGASCAPEFRAKELHACAAVPGCASVCGAEYGAIRTRWHCTRRRRPSRTATRWIDRVRTATRVRPELLFGAAR
jgi:hypothetical protein